MLIQGNTREKRKSVRFAARLHLRYSIYDRKEKIDFYHQSKLQRDMMHIIADTEQKKVQDVKEGVTVDISAKGLFFETKYKLELDKICKLEILLPRGENITAIGKVTKISKIGLDKEKSYRAGVEFILIDQANISRISMLYYKIKLIPEFDSKTIERRKNKRFQVKHARLKYRKRQLLSWGTWETSQIFDVSPDGILFKAKEKLVVKQILLVEIYFPAYDKPIKTLGKVIRVRRNQLEFVNDVVIVLYKIRKDDRKKIDEVPYLESLVDKIDREQAWL